MIDTTIKDDDKVTTNVTICNLEDSTQKPQKSGKKSVLKIVLIHLAIFILLACVAFGGYKCYDIIQQKIAADQITPFRSNLNEVIQQLSLDEGIEYKLDEKYYDEEKARIFVAASHVSEKGLDEENITKIQISDCLEKLFYFINGNDNTCYLIQKPHMTLLEECTDIVTMNILDYRYLGISDEELTKQSKGTFICQNNPEFINMPYGSSNIFRSGCGPIALTMAINYVKGEGTVTLEEVAKWAIDNNMYIENEGTVWALMNDFPKSKDIECEEVYAKSVEEFEQLLSEGGVMVTSMSKGHFTNNGHFITIIGIQDGMVTVLDSSSIYRSKKKWDSWTVFNESNKNFWIIK